MRGRINDKAARCGGNALAINGGRAGRLAPRVAGAAANLRTQSRGVLVCAETGEQRRLGNMPGMLQHASESRQEFAGPQVQCGRRLDPSAQPTSRQFRAGNPAQWGRGV